MRHHTTALGIFVSVLAGSLLQAAPVHAWNWTTHARLAEEVAAQGGITSSTIISILSDESVWADTDAAEDGVGTYGYDEEMNPWYDLAALIDYANADHWLDIYNHDRWWIWPDGEAHKNADEFYGNATWELQYGSWWTGWQVLGRGQHYVQDVGMPYHTVFWGNLDGWHAPYEVWTDNQWANPSMDLANWARSGAYYAHDYDGWSIKNIVVHLARTAESYMQYVEDGQYTSNTWATQHLMWYTGRALAACNMRAAPGYFNF